MSYRPMRNPPFHKPVFVLTHHQRGPLILADTTVTFVTDGVGPGLRLDQVRAVEARPRLPTSSTAS